MLKLAHFGATLLILAAAIAASCGGSESGENGASGGSAGSGGHGAVGGLHSGGSTQTGGVGGATGGTTGGGGASGSGGVWHQPGDPNWKPVPWRPAQCDTEYASNVANAAPPIVWQPCGAALPGCERLVPIWAQQTPVLDLTIQAPPQLYKSGAQLRLSLHFWYRVGAAYDQRKVIYDENWSALAAWRQKECGGNVLQWTAKHVCFALGNAINNTLQALLAPSALTGAAISVHESKPTVPIGCSTDLFASITGSGSVFIRDLVSGVEHAIAPPSGGSAVLDPRLTGEYAIFQRVSSTPGSLIDAWIWKRPNVIEKLIDPGAESIYDVRSDGQDLVWVQTQSKDILSSATGDLWTSAFATTAGAVKPSKRRSVPATTLTPSMKAIGSGWYALVEQASGAQDRYLHVYRLSDAQHWKVPTPADVRPTDVVYIDASEVWFTGMTQNDSYNTLIRQKLSDLGPGD